MANPGSSWLGGTSQGGGGGSSWLAGAPKPVAEEKTPKGVGGLLGALHSDFTSAVSNFIPGTVGLVTHPIRSAKNIAHAEYETWEPFVAANASLGGAAAAFASGNSGTGRRLLEEYKKNRQEFNDRFMQHPLSPALDVAALFTGGGSRAAALGTLNADAARAGLAVTKADVRRAALFGQRTGPLRTIEVRGADSAATIPTRTLPRSAWRAGYLEAADKLLKKLPPTTPAVGEFTRAARAAKREDRVTFLQAISTPEFFNWQKDFKKLNRDERAALAALARTPGHEDFESWMQTLEDSGTKTGKQTAAILQSPKVKALFDNPSPRLAKALESGRALSGKRAEILLGKGAITPEEIEAGIYSHTRLARGARVISNSETYKRLRRISGQLTMLQGQKGKLLRQGEVFGKKDIRDLIQEGRNASADAARSSTMRYRYHIATADVDALQAEAHLLRDKVDDVMRGNIDTDTLRDLGIEVRPGSNLAALRIKALGILYDRLGPTFTKYEKAATKEWALEREIRAGELHARRQGAAKEGLRHARERRIQFLSGQRAKFEDLLDVQLQLHMLKEQVEAGRGKLEGGETPTQKLLSENYQRGSDNPSGVLVPTDLLMQALHHNNPKAGLSGMGTSALAEDIKRNGFKDPIELDYDIKNNTITVGNGNHRVNAAAQAGVSHVPVIFGEIRDNWKGFYEDIRDNSTLVTDLGNTFPVSPMTPEMRAKFASTGPSTSPAGESYRVASLLPPKAPGDVIRLFSSDGKKWVVDLNKARAGEKEVHWVDVPGSTDKYGSTRDFIKQGVWHLPEELSNDSKVVPPEEITYVGSAAIAKSIGLQHVPITKKGMTTADLPLPDLPSVMGSEQDIYRGIDEQLATADRPKPFYIPDVPASTSRKQFASPEGSISAQRAKADVFQSKGTLFRTGMIAIHDDVLTPAFLRSAKHDFYTSLHETAMRLAVPVSKQSGLPEAHVWLRKKRGEKIPFDKAALSDHLKANADVYGDFPDEKPFYLEAGDPADEIATDAQGNRLAISKAFADQFKGEFRAAQSLPGKIFESATDVWRSLILHLRIPWLENNIFGNTMLYALRYSGNQGLKAFLGLIAHSRGGKYAAQLLHKDFARKHLSPEFVADVLPELQRGTYIGTNLPTGIRRGAINKTEQKLGSKAATALEKTTNIPAAVVGVLPRIDRATESALRRAAGEAVLRGSPEVQKIYKGMSKQTRNFDEAARKALEGEPNLRRLVVEEVNNALGDFLNLSRRERKLIRQVVPFYAWIKAITKVTLKMPLDTPGRTAVLVKIAQIGAETNPQDLPPYLQGIIPISENDDGTITGINTRSASPWTTVSDLLRESKVLTGSATSAEKRDFAGNLSPFLFQAGQTLFGDRKDAGLLLQPIVGTTQALPQYRVANPYESELYPNRTRLDLLLQYLGDPRRRYDPVVAADKAANG